MEFSQSLLNTVSCSIKNESPRCTSTLVSDPPVRCNHTKRSHISALILEPTSHAIPINAPANISSARIPNGFSNRRSTQSIGGGFDMSRNRNAANPIKYGIIAYGRNNSMTHVPTISSATIAEKSSYPKRSVTFLTANQATHAVPTTIEILTCNDISAKTKYQINSAHNDAKVPGARGVNPTPNPLDSTIQGSRKLDQFNVSGGLSSLIFIAASWMIQQKFKNADIRWQRPRQRLYTRYVFQIL